MSLKTYYLSSKNIRQNAIEAIQNRPIDSANLRMLIFSFHATYSVQTVSHATELVNTFFDDDTEKFFSVRRLSMRKDPNRQLFIVTIENDSKSDEYKVVPFADYSALMRGLRFSDEHIVGELLELGMHDEEEDILIGRVAYNDFTFFEGSVIKTGKQIRGVAILDDFQAGGIARNVYKCLLMKHEYIVCDNLQTIGGSSLWVSGMTSIGEVRIYDTIKKKFIDVLSNTGCGHKGIIPWSAKGLSQSDIAKWEPRKLSMNSCHHIVNIISKDRIYSND